MTKIVPHLSLSKLDDETVLLDSKTGRYYSLNPTAARMLEILAETGNPEAVVPRMKAEYDTDALRLHRDWEALFREFLDRGFLVQAD
jgi:hypothetical protein